MTFIEAKLSDLVAIFGGRLASFSGCKPVSSELSLLGIQSLEKAGPNHLGFLASSKFRDQLLDTQASVVLVRESQFEDLCKYLSNTSKQAVNSVAWLVSDPYLYYAKIQQWWVKHSESKPAEGIHAQAVVDPTARIASTASIAANCVIGAHVKIGEGSRIEAGVVLGNNVEVGSFSRIYPHVTVYDE